MSPTALAKNNETVTWSRSIVAVAGAAACGVLGVTGTQGFVLYVVQHILSSLLLLARMGFSPAKYLTGGPSSPLWFVLGGLMDNLVVWLLVWSFAFALCHFYGGAG